MRKQLIVRCSVKVDLAASLRAIAVLIYLLTWTGSEARFGESPHLPMQVAKAFIKDTQRYFAEQHVWIRSLQNRGLLTSLLSFWFQIRIFLQRRISDDLDASQHLIECGKRCEDDCMADFVSLESLADENLVKLYENIREQVAADNRSGGQYRFMGNSAKQQAQRLRQEIDRRGLKVEPIYWPWSSSISVAMRTRRQLHRLMEHAQAFEPVQDGQIYIEKINGPFLFEDRATPAEYKAGLRFAIDQGWLELHAALSYG
jgi:hypothetical protein